MLAGTVVGGIAGYLVLWLTARAVGAAEYAVFGVFWSALFLVVGVLFGIQQEATRVTAAADAAPVATSPRSSLWVFGGVAGILVVAVMLASATLWAPASFGAEDADLAVPAAVGSGLSAIVAVASGILAGRRKWLVMGLIIAADGLLRLVAVAVVLALGGGTSALAWAVAAPYVVVVLAFLVIGGRRFLAAGRTMLGYRRLTANAARTVLAASATAVLINGFPLVLAVVEAGMDQALLGSLIFAITLTRAPLLVPLMALQSYLVTAFAMSPERRWRILRTWLGVVAGGAVAFALVAWILGSWALEFFVGTEFALSGALLAALILASGCIGALCVTGPAVLAQNMHTAYAAGWLVASAATVALLFLPIELTAAVPIALAVGPIVGIGIHLGLLRWATRADPAARHPRPSGRPSTTEGSGR
ncbi:hypothetical protein ACDF64_10970 [Agromyces sp. MMS24-JH15]|uniref:hypothetical protein n=1 Tax=Agromyces sp. MMS24-JH15 TaxID=3243765 RepID=UPI003749E8E3